MSEFTEEKRAKALLVLNKIIEEDKDKYHVYHDIYHALQDSCNCRIPENKILPGREDLERFLQRKMLDHEVHGRVHERLIELVQNLIAADTIPAESGLFRLFRDPEDYAEAVRGHLFGTENLESLKLSPSRAKKRSTENEDKDSKKKKKNVETYSIISS
jgi:hypothetical protein